MPDQDIRQAAIDEKRLWVRLTRACNNRCEFCLDSGALGGGPIPEDVIREKLLRGRQEGYTRLILSGGEATTHPKFIDFIRYGTEIGYSWIQVVSNGRMFAYERFATEAVNAGLREATLSLHAHTEDLFEKLTGTKGSFKQAIRGLVNLKRLGTVVSVDIVLTRLNLPYLREIMEFYMRLGVMEFDLLHLIPFGRGFDENREELYADEEMLGRELPRALELDRTNEMFIWTNRLPIRYLEDYEHLFQDPHKLYDEVLGERQSFRRLFADGIQPECMADERCALCFLQPFCQAACLYAAGKWGRTDEDATELDADLVREMNAADDAALAAKVPAAARIAVREHYGEARAAAPELDTLKAVAARLAGPLPGRPVGTPVLGLPPCLGGPRDGGEWWPAPPPELFDAENRLDLRAFVGFFIQRLYRVKSLRCSDCPVGATCPGLQVNLARHWGLKVLDKAGL